MFPSQFNLKSTQDITLNDLGLDVKHSQHTFNCSFSYFFAIICYKISNLTVTHYTV